LSSSRCTPDCWLQVSVNPAGPANFHIGQHFPWISSAHIKCRIGIQNPRCIACFPRRTSNIQFKFLSKTDFTMLSKFGPNTKIQINYQFSPDGQLFFAASHSNNPCYLLHLTTRPIVNKILYRNDYRQDLGDVTAVIFMP
jgi:hypothetical protein